MATDRPTNKWLRAASYILEDREWYDKHRFAHKRPAFALACCDAIELVTRINGYDIQEFTSWFRPDDYSAYWWADPHHHGFQDQGARVLALCFMAAIEDYVEPKEPDPVYERDETNSKWLLAASVLREGNHVGASGCCDAMAKANMTGLQERAFHKWFYDEAEAEGSYWWGYPGDNNHLGYDNQSARILALCFMDAIEQAGDL